MGGVKDFIKKVNEDEGLNESVKRLAEQKADIKKVITLAKRHGFDFTPEEWRTFLQADFEQKKGKLTDDQLAAAAGGGWDDWLFFSFVSYIIGCAMAAIDSHLSEYKHQCAVQ